MPKSKKSPTKKTAPKKDTATKKKQSEKSLPVNLKSVKLPKVVVSDSMKPVVKILSTVILAIVAIALMDLAVQYLNNDYSVAVVDNTRISKRAWNDRLQKAYGSSVATQLIEDQIIKLEGKRAGVTVAREDIDAEIDRIIESIGGQEVFESALEANNITLKELREQIEIDLLFTKILGPTLEYAEEDLIDFFEQYSDIIFPEDSAALEEGEKLDFEKYREETEEIFIQQEVQMNRSSWLLQKQSEYNIQDNSTGRPRYGFLTITTNIVNRLFNNLAE